MVTVTEISAANDRIVQFQEAYPEKFVRPAQIFSRIEPGDHIFLGTACGEPQFLVQALIDYVQANPKAFFDAEVLQVWSLGLTPYADEKFRSNFRLNSFFIGPNSRDAVNRGAADYAPIFLSEVPRALYRGLVPVDVALVQTSPPDQHGHLSLGVSVDIVKAAVEVARTVVVQINPRMPRVHGDTFIHLEDVDFAVVHDEPLLEYPAMVPDEINVRIGEYVSRIVADGDTIQVGYGAIPNAIMARLGNKRHLGVHTELLSDGLVSLMRSGVVDNSRKTIDRHKTVASFCMGRADTYRYIHDNPAVEFQPVDYTNNPLTIGRIQHMTAINTALQIDLTGQSTADSIGHTFFSGIGGHADFMRGTVLAPGGKTILALPSTAEHGDVSRIVTELHPGAGVTLTRGDTRYVVTEYGIAYLHGKNIRERAMELIAIAHPKFRSRLIDEAKRHHLIYQDQAFVPGRRGEYPEELESHRTTRTGLHLLLRPVRISDEPLLKDFFYAVSDQTIYRRFISARRDMPHERLQEFVVIDYTKEMVILAVLEEEEREIVVGVGQYGVMPDRHSAEVAFVVRDDHQQQGVGTELVRYITYLAKKNGLLGFTAEVLVGNEPMLRLFEKMGFNITKKRGEGVFELTMSF